ncbi:hypothetical protein HG530_008698 [Fusarium avenaceum]|nr:hypothetical protein HG530_008698 [Fusarium avenaceum]
MDLQNICTKGFSRENTKETCLAIDSSVARGLALWTLQTKEGLGTRLAADVNDIVSVGEAVELSGRALCVGTHVLKVQPVADIENRVEASALSDAIDAITNAIIDVEHVALAIESGVLNGTTSDDVAGDGEGRGNIVATRLGNDLHVAVWREEFVQSATEDGSHCLKSVATEATTNVEGAHGEAKVAGLLEDGVGVANGLEKGERVGGTRANVETDANNVEAEVLGQGEETLSGVHGSTKLHAEAAQRLAVVGHDAEEELGSRVELCDLVKLVGIVKGHLLDAHRLDVSDVRVSLTGLGVDDTVRAEACGQDLLNLGLGGTIEAGAELRKKLDDLSIGVALDGWCTEGPDSREILLPAEMLAIDLAQVSNEEGIFVAGLTHLMINGFHTLVESLTDELFWVNQAMLLKRSLKKGFL